MKLTRRQTLVLALVALAIFAGLVLVGRDFVRENIVRPIYALGWTVAQVLQAVPQSVYLLGLGGVGLGLALHSLRTFRPARPQPRAGAATPAPAASRYQFWLRRSRMLAEKNLVSASFAVELRRLLLAVLAYQERLTPGEVEHRLNTATLAAPPGVCAFIRNRGFTPPARPKRWFGFMGRPQPAALSAARAQAEAIVAYIEDRLSQT